MKVFISWSGKMSAELAKVLHGWLPTVIQEVKPYFSADDIEKGRRGNTIIAKELEEGAFGILCLTRENLEAPWIMFEAGALSKKLDTGLVCPILFGELGTTDLKGPLSQFQAANFGKEEMRKVVATINRQLGEGALNSKVLDRVFEKWWPDLEKEVAEVLSKGPKAREEKVRSDRELLEEILTLARRIAADGRERFGHLDAGRIMEEVTEGEGVGRFDPQDALELACGLMEVGYDKEYVKRALEGGGIGSRRAHIVADRAERVLKKRKDSEKDKRD